MRNGHQQQQHQKRMRGRNRNNNRSHNPLTRVYESNGPDVKVRGTAHHIAEKYIQLARDSQASGDPVSSEGYLQYAEHYFRLIAAAQAQFAQQNPNSPQQAYQRPDMDGGEDFEDGGSEEVTQGDPNAQPYVSGAPAQRPQHQPNPQHQPQPHFQGQPQQRNDQQNSGGGLPAFITGGGGAPAQGGQQENDQGDRGNRNDRFGRNRNNRRFRHGGGNHGGGNQSGGNYENRGGYQGDSQPQQGQGGQSAPPAANPSQPVQNDGGSQPPEGSGSTE